MPSSIPISTRSGPASTHSGADRDEEAGPHEALHVRPQDEPEQLAAALAQEAGEGAGDVVDVLHRDAAPRVLLVLAVGARGIDVGEALDLLFHEIVLDQPFVLLLGGEDGLEAGHVTTSTSSTRSSRSSSSSASWERIAL